MSDAEAGASKVVPVPKPVNDEKRLSNPKNVSEIASSSAVAYETESVVSSSGCEVAQPRKRNLRKRSRSTVSEAAPSAEKKKLRQNSINVEKEHSTIVNVDKEPTLTGNFSRNKQISKIANKSQRTGNNSPQQKTSTPIKKQTEKSIDSYFAVKAPDTQQDLSKDSYTKCAICSTNTDHKFHMDCNQNHRCPECHKKVHGDEAIQFHLLSCVWTKNEIDSTELSKMLKCSVEVRKWNKDFVETLHKNGSCNTEDVPRKRIAKIRINLQNSAKIVTDRRRSKEQTTPKTNTDNSKENNKNVNQDAVAGPSSTITGNFYFYIDFFLIFYLFTNSFILFDRLPILQTKCKRKRIKRKINPKKDRKMLSPHQKV